MDLDVLHVISLSLLSIPTSLLFVSSIKPHLLFGFLPQSVCVRLPHPLSVALSPLLMSHISAPIPSSLLFPARWFTFKVLMHPCCSPFHPPSHSYLIFTVSPSRSAVLLFPLPPLPLLISPSPHTSSSHPRNDNRLRRHFHHRKTDGDGVCDTSPCRHPTWDLSFPTSLSSESPPHHFVRRVLLSPRPQ